MVYLTQDKEIIVPKYRNVKEFKYSEPSEENS